MSVHAFFSVNKMFFLRNLMFLTLLAFITWIMLCYLDPRRESHEIAKQVQPDKSLADTFACNSNTFDGYYVYIHFVCIFTGIYVLARFIEMVEIYFAPNFEATFNWFLLRRDRNIAREAFEVWDDMNEDEIISRLSMDDLNWNNHSDVVLQGTTSRDSFRRLTICLHEEVAKIWNLNKYLNQRIGELERRSLLLLGHSILMARESQNMNLVNNSNSSSNSIVNINGGCDGEPIIESPRENCSDNECQQYVLNGRNEETEMSLTCSRIVCSYYCTRGFRAYESIGADGDKIDHDPSNGQIVELFSKRNRWLPSQQNIFVSNRFFYINDCPIMAGETEMDYQSYNNGEFSQVWQKYLNMRTQYMEMPSSKLDSNAINGFPSENIGANVILKKIDRSKLQVDFAPELPIFNLQDEADTVINSNQGLCNPNPIVVTTRELEQLQGSGYYQNNVSYA